MDNQELERRQKEADRLIDYLQSKPFRNKEARVEFAKIIMHLATNNTYRARKLIIKMAEFVQYWENDEMIDEKEWRRLNNTTNLQNIEESKIKKYEFESLFK